MRSTLFPLTAVLSLFLFFFSTAAPSGLAEYAPSQPGASYVPVIEYAETAPAAETFSGKDRTFLSEGPLSSPETPDGLRGSTETSPLKGMYVSPSGSDENDGSRTSPWRSIQHAADRLEAGDTLYILEGRYDEAVDLRASGNSRAWITIEGAGNVVIDRSASRGGETGGGGWNYDPAFDTNGQSFIRIKNLTVKNSRAGVEVNGGAHVEIENLRSEANDFAVKIDGGENVTVRNVSAVKSRNAFRTEGKTRNVLFENIETTGSKDAYKGYKSRRDFYLNGDGFILEEGTNITLRNIVSSGHWDAGFDIKADNVVLENAAAYGNKNNFKTWGDNIVIRDSLSYGALRQSEEGGPVGWDGNGINVRKGSVRIENSTFADNEDFDIKMTDEARVTLSGSVVARKLANDGRLLAVDGGLFKHENNLWYAAGKSGVDAEGFALSPGERWAEPASFDWAAEKSALLKGAVGYRGKDSKAGPPPSSGPADSLPPVSSLRWIVASPETGGKGSPFAGGKFYLFRKPAL